jgi:hypothetical protein
MNCFPGKNKDPITPMYWAPSTSTKLKSNNL